MSAASEGASRFLPMGLSAREIRYDFRFFYKFKIIRRPAEICDNFNYDFLEVSHQLFENCHKLTTKYGGLIRVSLYLGFLKLLLSLFVLVR